MSTYVRSRILAAMAAVFAIQAFAVEPCAAQWNKALFIWEYQIAPEPRQPKLTWEHWWEANRDAYLREHLITSGVIPGLPRAWFEQRDRIAGSLIHASQHETTAMRTVSIVALGRTNAPGATERILDGAGDSPAALLDPELEVRFAGWLALGLVGDDRARAALVNPPVPLTKEADHVARMVGIGLLPRIGKEEVAVLLNAIENGPTDEVSRMAVWALGVHGAEQLNTLAPEIVARSNAVFAVHQAIMSAAGSENGEYLNLLREILNFFQLRQKLPAYREITKWGAELSVPRSQLDNEPNFFGMWFFDEGGRTPNRMADALQTTVALSLTNRPPIADNTIRRQMMRELIRQSARSYHGRLMGVRNASVLALALHLDEDDDPQPLLNALRGVVEPAFDVDTVNVRNKAYDPNPSDASRGFAAIAIGLYLRRMDASTEVGQSHPLKLRPNRVERAYRQLNRELWQQIEDDRRELHDDIRLAAILGIGLSGDKSYADHMVRLFESNVQNRPRWAGYACLSLGLMGDARAGRLGQLYIEQLRRGDKELSNEEIAALRLALQGMTLVNVGVRELHLPRIWSRDPWVGLEIATMARWRRDTKLTGTLIGALQDPGRQLVAAWALGELYDQERPSRLSRLYLGQNFMMPFRDQQPRLPDTQGGGAFSGFQNPKWWEDPNAVSRLHGGWPLRYAYLLAQPYFTEMMMR